MKEKHIRFTILLSLLFLQSNLVNSSMIDEEELQVSLHQAKQEIEETGGAFSFFSLGLNENGCQTVNDFSIKSAYQGSTTGDIHTIMDEVPQLLSKIRRRNIENNQVQDTANLVSNFVSTAMNTFSTNKCRVSVRGIRDQRTAIEWHVDYNLKQSLGVRIILVLKGNPTIFTDFPNKEREKMIL